QWLSAAQAQAAQAQSDREHRQAMERDKASGEARHRFNLDEIDVRGRVAAEENQRQEGMKREQSDREHRQAMERDAAKDAADRWTSGNTSYYRDKNGDTFMLTEGETQWTKVAAPGQETSLTQDERRARAEEYADTRIKEMAGWFSGDRADFKDFGG